MCCCEIASEASGDHSGQPDLVELVRIPFAIFCPCRLASSAPHDGDCHAFAPRVPKLICIGVWKLPASATGPAAWGRTND